jgi:hypothetical protein
MGNLRRRQNFSKKVQVQEKIIRDTSFFVQVINACVGLKSHEVGRLVHKQISQKWCKSRVFMGNNLVDMYAKCASLEDLVGES